MTDAITRFAHWPPGRVASFGWLSHCSILIRHPSEPECSHVASLDRERFGDSLPRVILLGDLRLDAALTLWDESSSAVAVALLALNPTFNIITYGKETGNV